MYHGRKGVNIIQIKIKPTTERQRQPLKNCAMNMAKHKAKMQLSNVNSGITNHLS